MSSGPKLSQKQTGGSTLTLACCDRLPSSALFQTCVTPQSTSTLAGVHFTAVSWKALKSFSIVSFQASVLPADCTRCRVGTGSSLKVHKPYVNPVLWAAASSLITAFPFALDTPTGRYIYSNITSPKTALELISSVSP